ncbi:NADP-dependent oxidoreductase [Actinospica sp. MGRD01-02]|uniref:NADP-dependent oxidoreductase n=1 Tax=Actinospica acidithermotolerans TaxID=2828514 RepID=A0A941EBN2_9ACTN|nr:NADP-dependent oxidoreductase [Actinospica acidithermotolerans]MBR7828516.1 NADP-dependent oxidoreductase [Actinospica acidithermotolerans]
MRAAVAAEFNGIESVRVGDAPTPVPKDGQVLVRVRAAGVGRWDVGMLAGGFPGLATPFIPGQEVAGVVADVGSGVDVERGDRVYGTLFPSGGGFAEWAVVDAARLAVMPDRLDFPEAAGLVIAAGTAHEGLVDRGGLKAGQTVLVTAAAGGVGGAAVQIAAALGARVLGVASARNHDYVRSLGASYVFDYHDAGWPQQVLAAEPGGVDLLLDCAGGQTRDQAITAVRDGGRAGFIVIQDAEPELPRGITADSFAARVTRSRLQALSALVEAGSLRANIAEVMPLDRARDALAQVASRHTRGKIVIQVEP